MLRLLQYSYTDCRSTPAVTKYACLFKKGHVFYELERSAVFTLRYVQLEQIKVNALCMVNSKTLHHSFLGPELKLYEELTCIGSFS